MKPWTDKQELTDINFQIKTWKSWNIQSWLCRLSSSTSGSQDPCMWEGYFLSILLQSNFSALPTMAYHVTSEQLILR